ncbi:MAG: SMI1/KNR4 family protein [Prosthecobacter sp.]
MNIWDQSTPISEQRIVEFEQRHDLKLPEDYRAFLLKHNGGIVYPKSYAAESGVEICTSRLLSIDHENYYDNLDKVRDAAYWNGKQDHGLVQIAYDAGGQTIFMATKGDLAQTVYLVVDEQPYLVAESFSDFILKMDTWYRLGPKTESDHMWDEYYREKGQPF